MPTGYTAKLMEKGQSFQEFVLTCARAFGALIELRDEPLDAPIPERIEPSGYHTKRIKEAELELERLTLMTEAHKKEFGEVEKAAAIRNNEKWMRKNLAENKRLSEMEEKVRAWKPPTTEHTRLKEFMLEQLNVSHNSMAHYESANDDLQNKSPKSFYDEAVSSAKNSIQYHLKEQAKEVERSNDRTEWVQQLRASL